MGQSVTTTQLCYYNENGGAAVLERSLFMDIEMLISYNFQVLQNIIIIIIIIFNQLKMYNPCLAHR